MSIQASLKRFSSNENFADQPDHLNVSSPCSNELIESPEENTLSSLDEMGSQRVPEILVFSQRFSIEKSFTVRAENIS